MYVSEAHSANSQLAPNVTRAPEYKPGLNRPYSIKGLFHPGEVVMIAGAPGLGKTNVVAAACAHVAQGRKFGGRSVQNSLVIYYGAEDPEGVLCRAHPLLRDPACASAPFYVVHGAPDLMAPGSVANVCAFVERKKAAHNCDKAVVVFDTLNRCIGGADENLAATMGTAIGNADRIAKTANACVVLVHHVGVGNSDRPRGSSAQEGNLDGLYILKSAADDHGKENVVLLMPKKQKNTRPSGPIPFQLASFFVGHDSDGEEITVPYAIALEPGTFPNRATAKNDLKKPDSATAERRDDLVRLLSDLHAQDPARFLTRPEVTERSGAAFNGVRDNKDSLRKAVARALADLVGEGRVEEGTHGYRLASHADPNDSPDVANA